MRVCMLTYSFYEQDNRVMRYAEALAARGDAVDVLSLRRPGHPREETLQGVRVHRIQERERNERGQLTYFRRVFMFLLRSAWHVTRRHLRHRYQVIHVHSIPDFEVFAALIPRLTGAKVILDIHDLVPELYASKFRMSQGSPAFRGLLGLERASARFAHHVIAANHLWGEKLGRRAVPPGRCTVFLNYPDPAIFAGLTPLPSDRFVFMYPGTLQKHQGLDLVVRALALVATELPAADFHVYGDGPEREALGALVDELGLAGRVLFHGFLPMREVAARMASAQVGVVAKVKESFGDEAFSTKILEFMALGVPVIASRTTIDTYYFSDDDVEFFTSGDVPDLARAMRTLYRDAGRRAALGAAGRRRATEFSWDRHRGDYFALVDGLVAGRRR